MTLQDKMLRGEYAQGVPLTQILAANSVGVVTARDNLTIQFERSNALDVAQDFAGLAPEDARQKYDLGADVRDWRIEWAQADLVEAKLAPDHVKPIQYRPFDRRWTFYTGNSRGFHCYPRTEIMRLMSPRNVGLDICKYVNGEWRHCLVVEGIVDDSFVSNRTKERGYLFPLFAGDAENLSPVFRAFIDARYEHHYAPEQILGYIYAVLHAPTYRARYGEFLRIDFPRVPFPEARAHFDALSALGWALVEAHLLKRKTATKLAQFQSSKSGEGRYRVEANPRYAEAEQKAYINDAGYFAPIPPEVWNFHIGGYQVLDKYLRSRKGRTLSLDEIEHVAKVADVLAFTIAQMAAIDASYKAAFPAQT
jgi:predicted helicase